LDGPEIRYFFIRVNEENGELPGLGAEMIIEFLLLQAPGFPAQAFDPVPVYRVGKTAGGDAETYLHRKFTWLLQGHVNNPVWKNRKRFSFPKKRFNQFSAF
jgi:hypothetical protein